MSEFIKPSSPDEYETGIVRMHRRMQRWRKANPGKTAVVAFKTPDPSVVIIADIQTAMRMGFVTTNKHGYEMLKSMCQPEKAEPTVSMVKAAIHYQQEKQ